MRFLFLAALLFAPAAWAQADLVKLLRDGGHVLYMRHASTDFSQNDARMKDYDDCANQRNLTDKGRAEARAVGAHLRRLNVSVIDVLASPFCRTMETARLVFGRGTATLELRGGPGTAGDPARYAALKELLSEKGNRTLALVGHGNPFHALAGPPYLAEGEIAIVRPEGDSKFTVVGRIRVEQWEAVK